jgi:hypothetical protein
MADNATQNIDPFSILSGRVNAGGFSPLHINPNINLISNDYMVWMASIPVATSSGELAIWLQSNPKPSMVDAQKVKQLETHREELVKVINIITAKLNIAYSVTPTQS